MTRKQFILTAALELVSTFEDLDAVPDNEVRGIYTEARKYLEMYADTFQDLFDEEEDY